MFELNKWLEELDAKGTPVSLDTQAEFPYSSPWKAKSYQIKRGV